MTIRSMSLVYVHHFSVSLDGFGTGEGQTRDLHFGHAGERLHEWMFATRSWKAGGSGGVDDVFVQRHDRGIGAEIMGAGKFGHPGWEEDPDWKGAWGPNPPFHTPVFVLTHHTRPSIEMEGGTTFHFLEASPAEALETAREAADGKDIRIGGGPTVIRDFLAAGLIDHMHVVVVPILLGRGVRLWDGLEGLEKDYEIEATSSPSGVTHVTFTRSRQRADRCQTAPGGRARLGRAQRSPSAGEAPACQGRSERRVLRTRASEDAVRRCVAAGLMARARIELATPRFSVVCSTN